MLRTHALPALVLASMLAPFGASGCTPSRSESGPAPIASTASTALAPPVTPATPPAATAASATTPVSAPASACAGDADCAAVSHLCTSCQCLALPRGAAPPKCAHSVACFVDPCQAKRAVCRAGACALVDDAHPTM